MQSREENIANINIQMEEGIPDEGTRSRIPQIESTPSLQPRDTHLDEPPAPADDENPVANRPLVRQVNRARANFLPMAIADRHSRIMSSTNARRLTAAFVTQLNQRGCDLYVRGQLTSFYLRKHALGFSLGPMLKRRYLFVVSNLGLAIMIFSACLMKQFRSPYFAYIWLVYETIANICIMALRKWVHQEQVCKFDHIDSVVVVCPLVPMVSLYNSDSISDTGIRLYYVQRTFRRTTTHTARQSIS